MNNPSTNMPMPRKYFCRLTLNTLAVAAFTNMYVLTRQVLLAFIDICEINVSGNPKTVRMLRVSPQYIFSTSKMTNKTRAEALEAYHHVKYSIANAQ